MSASMPPRWLRMFAGAVHAVIGSCGQVHDQLLEYLERKVAAPTLVRLRLHLKMCPPCRRYLAKYLAGVEYARHSLDDPPPDMVEQTLRHVHRNAAESRK